MKGKITDFSILIDRTQRLTLTLLDDFRGQYDELKDKELEIDLREYRPKRSKQANAYLWVLVGKLADKLRADKHMVYLTMLERYGQREPDLISVIEQGYETVYRALDGHCTVVGEGTVNGKTFKHLAILKGSSKYNSREMSILIDGVISECKELGIETLPPWEVAAICKEWKPE